MRQRVITGAFIGIGFALLYVAFPIWLEDSWLGLLPAVLAFGVFAAVGVWELLVTTRSTGRHPMVYISMAAAFLMSPVSVWGESWHLLALVFAYMVCVFACGVFDHIRINFATMAKGFLAAVILPLMLTSTLRILAAVGVSGLGGLFALLPWLVVWVCDSAALFVGRAFGKRKLAPYVSPKKTVAGFVGGLIGGMVIAVLFQLMLTAVFWSWDPGIDWGSIAVFALYGLVAAALGQLGDLSLSVIKRESGIKDYGNLFPGHGGVYDRFDSILFAAPLFEIILIHIIV